MLLYFLESDFNLNDDHIYDEQDARQFYIRREILRAMAAHTCSDVYNVYLTTFSSLLYLCDEMQEWGRKSWNEMYSGLNSRNVVLKINEFSPTKVDIEEIIDMERVDTDELFVNGVVRIFERQYSQYKTKFRDGQYTKKRDLCIQKKMTLKFPKDDAPASQLEINYILSKEESKFKVDFSNVPTYARNEIVRKIKSELSDLYIADFMPISIITPKRQEQKA